MTKIKICGLKSLNDIEIVNKYKPDYIGFVFAASKRQISFEEAKKLKEKLNKKIQVVGVFVNIDYNEIVRLCNNNIIDIIQLHGEEDGEYINKLRKKIEKDIKIIKAIRVQDSNSINNNLAYNADYYLLDSYSRKAYGGTGKSFDYNLIPPLNKEYFIAGGINENNVLDIIDRTKPYGIDVSSGVEIDGVKDEDKIKKIIDLIRKGE